MVEGLLQNDHVLLDCSFLKNTLVNDLLIQNPLGSRWMVFIRDYSGNNVFFTQAGVKAGDPLCNLRLPIPNNVGIIIIELQTQSGVPNNTKIRINVDYSPIYENLD